MPPIPQSIAGRPARYAQFRQAQLIDVASDEAADADHHRLRVEPASRRSTSSTDPGRDRRQVTWMPRGVSATVARRRSIRRPANTFVFQYDPAGASCDRCIATTWRPARPRWSPSRASRYAPVWSRAGQVAGLRLGRAQRQGPRSLRHPAVGSEDQAPARRFRRRVQPAGLVARRHGAARQRGAVATPRPISGASTSRPARRRRITPRDGEKAAFFNARFSTDGRRIYAISDRDRRRLSHLAVRRRELQVDAGDARAGVAVDSPNLGGGFELSPDGTMLATTVDRGSSSELHVLDLDDAEAAPAAGAAERASSSRIRWRPGSREVGFYAGVVEGPERRLLGRRVARAR